MKKSLQLAVLLTLIFFLGSCSDKNELVGYSDDNIKLSTKLVSFDKNENTATITTKGDGWWINGVSVNGINYPRAKDTDATSNSYTIEGVSFVVEKKNKTTLAVAADENNTGAERKMIVELQSGNYFDRVVIVQKGE